MALEEVVNIKKSLRTLINSSSIIAAESASDNEPKQREAYQATIKELEMLLNELASKTSEAENAAPVAAKAESSSSEDVDAESSLAGIHEAFAKAQKDPALFGKMLREVIAMLQKSEKKGELPPALVSKILTPVFSNLSDSEDLHAEIAKWMGELGDAFFKESIEKLAGDEAESGKIDPEMQKATVNFLKETSAINQKVSASEKAAKEQAALDGSNKEKPVNYAKMMQAFMLTLQQLISILSQTQAARDLLNSELGQILIAAAQKVEEKVNKQVEEIKRQQAAQHVNSIFGWIFKGLMIALSALLTVVTVGGAAGVLIASIGVVVSSVMMSPAGQMMVKAIADAVAKDLEAGYIQAFRNEGYSESEAKKLGKQKAQAVGQMIGGLVAAAIVVAVTVGTSRAGSAAAAGSAAKAGATAEEVAQQAGLASSTASMNGYMTAASTLLSSDFLGSMISAISPEFANSDDGKIVALVLNIVAMIVMFIVGCKGYKGVARNAEGKLDAKAIAKAEERIGKVVEKLAKEGNISKEAAEFMRTAGRSKDAMAKMFYQGMKRMHVILSAIILTQIADAGVSIDNGMIQLDRSETLKKIAEFTKERVLATTLVDVHNAAANQSEAMERQLLEGLKESLNQIIMSAPSVGAAEVRALSR